MCVGGLSINVSYRWTGESTSRRGATLTLPRGDAHSMLCFLLSRPSTPSHHCRNSWQRCATILVSPLVILRAAWCGESEPILDDDPPPTSSCPTGAAATSACAAPLLFVCDVHSRPLEQPAQRLRAAHRQGRGHIGSDASGMQHACCSPSKLHLTLT